MATKSETIRIELETLVKQGKDIQKLSQAIGAARELLARGKVDERALKTLSKTDEMLSTYQNWYSQSLPVVRQLLPDRLAEFQEQYRLERRKDVDVTTYTISDYLTGLTVTRAGEEVFSSFGVFSQKFQVQINVLESALGRLDSILVNIQAVIQAELFDDELMVARELLTKSHLRSAGAVAGVVLERHLSQVAEAHAIKTRKRTPSISDWNDALKTAEVFDIPNWRFVQRLGDIRNLCVHSKDREPTKEEVEDLINGAGRVIKTFF